MVSGVNSATCFLICLKMPDPGSLEEPMILMVENQKKGDKPAGIGLPGGGQEFGETIEDTARREFRQEAGLHVTDDQFSFLPMIMGISSPGRDRDRSLHYRYLFGPLLWTPDMGEPNSGNDPDEKGVLDAFWVSCTELEALYAWLDYHGEQPRHHSGMVYYASHLRMLFSEEEYSNRC